MQFAILGQSFNGKDFHAISLDGEKRTRFHRLTIEQDCTGTAN